EKMYFGQAEIGFLYGRGEENWDGKQEERVDISFLTFNGVRITKNHLIGFATGLDQYEEISIVPLAFGWRGFLGKDGKPKFFAGMDIGGGSAILEKKLNDEWNKSWYDGGFLISPSAGLRFPAIKGKTSLSISIAYKRQTVSHFSGSLLQTGRQTITSDLLPPGFSSLIENNHLYRSFVFRVGLMF